MTQCHTCYYTWMLLGEKCVGCVPIQRSALTECVALPSERELVELDNLPLDNACYQVLPRIADVPINHELIALTYTGVGAGDLSNKTSWVDSWL